MSRMQLVGIMSLATIFFSFSWAMAQSLQPIYLDDSKPIEQRVEDALARMTLQEKVAMCHAQSKFSSPGVPRLGIPENWATDGPHGIRAEVLWDKWDQAGWNNDLCTAFPALTALAATWNRDISMLYGQSIGQEARYRNKNILLGPGVNIYRTPLNGRNFEYMGEDPFLASQMVVPYVKGVQTNGVAACVKHFALNNQETDRHTVNVDVDDRALYEIYLPAFKAAVQQGKAWAIMGSYNKYKSQWCCHNQYTLNDILRGEWGFDGVVVSDWGGVKETPQSVYNGLDMEFGTWTDGLGSGASNAYDNYHLAQPFLDMLTSGEVKVEEVDKKVRNILRMVFRTTMNKNRPYGSFASPEHSAAARQIAQEGIVLLQNKGGLLPIDLKETKRIAVVGENAIKKMTVGGGSSSLKAKYETNLLDGLKDRLGTEVEVVYARGYVGDTISKHNNVKTGQDLTEKRSADELIAQACDIAKGADMVIFVGGLNKSKWQDCEGADRKQMKLPYQQDKLIDALLEANPKKMVVVLISGNGVEMPWVNKTPAIIQGWYLGSEAGNALADVLVGDVNPSGKLPFTFVEKLTDLGSISLCEYSSQNKEATYKESIFVGYRWVDKENIKPLFGFGHGLSYTTFEYADVVADKKTMALADKITFSVRVKNTGKVAGAEVVQLYITDVKSSLPRPVKELKGFEKVYLQPKQEKTLTFTIDKTALSFFDDKRHEWIAEPGTFSALIGASSTDIRSKVDFELK